MNINFQENYTIPLIWAQRAKVTGRGANAKQELFGNPVGPFMTGYEAGRTTNIKNPNNVSVVLKGRAKTIEGFTFWHEGEAQMNIVKPNYQYYKENGLIVEGELTAEKIENNLLVMGFTTAKVLKMTGVKSKVAVNCCNKNCDSIAETTYNQIKDDTLRVLCTKCATVVSAINKPAKNGLKTFESAYPELKKYYHIEDNQGKAMNEISFGATTLVVLRCDVCNHVNVPTQANNFKPKKRNAKAVFNCEKCNSVGSTYPHLAEQWDNDKNNGTIFDHKPNQTDKAWWLCAEGHSYYDSVDNKIKEQGCIRCVQMKRMSVTVQTINRVLLDMQKDSLNLLNVEAQVKGTNFKNDFAVGNVVFEYQGRIYHYSDFASEYKGEIRDRVKFAANRANNQFVILLNDFDYNNSSKVKDYDLIKFSILHAYNYLAENKFAVGCDIEYNKMKTEYALKTQKAFYTSLFNETQTKKKSAKLFPSTMKCVEFQKQHNIF